jgi:hypothetical protein
MLNQLWSLSRPDPKTHLGAALLVLSITYSKGVKQDPKFVSGYHPSDQGQRREKKDPSLLI